MQEVSIKENARTALIRAIKGLGIEDRRHTGRSFRPLWASQSLLIPLLQAFADPASGVYGTGAADTTCFRSLVTIHVNDGALRRYSE